MDATNMVRGNFSPHLFYTRASYVQLPVLWYGLVQDPPECQDFQPSVCHTYAFIAVIMGPDWRSDQILGQF